MDQSELSKMIRFRFVFDDPSTQHHLTDKNFDGENNCHIKYKKRNDLYCYL